MEGKNYIIWESLETRHSTAREWSIREIEMQEEKEYTRELNMLNVLTFYKVPT